MRQSTTYWAERWAKVHLVTAPPVLAFAAVWISFHAPVVDSAQIILLTLGVAILGLPHGSLDLHMLRRVITERPHRGWAVGVTSAYVATSLAVLALWLIHPPTALLAFLLASAIHFGDVDTPKAGRGRGSKHALRGLAHGLLPIVLPSYFRAPETTALYNWLLGAQHAVTVSDVRVPAGIGLLFVAVVLLFEVMERSRLGTGLRDVIGELFSVAWVTILFVFAPPLIAFTLYFCFWHSIAHSIDLAGRMDRRNPWRAFGRFAGAAAVPTGVALAACVAVGFWLATKTTPDEAMVQIVFIGLSCLAAPHMVLSAWSARAPSASRNATLAEGPVGRAESGRSSLPRVSFPSRPVDAEGH